MNYFKRLRDLAVAVMLLVVPFFFLGANLKDPSKQNALDRALLKVASPLQWVAHEAAEATSSVLEEYVYLVDVGRDNDTLRRENARLRSELRGLRVEADENRRLRQLLGLRPELPPESIAAEIIAQGATTNFRFATVYIDRGPRDRVEVGMPVVSSEGLVGYVRRVRASGYSDVMLVVDPKSAVDIVVRRTGARGMLRGTNASDRYASQIHFLDREDEVRVGDEVYTSGLGHRFPAGILVGHVTKVRRGDSGLFQDAEVTPSVDFQDLREVFVLTRGSRVPTDLAESEGRE